MVAAAAEASSDKDWTLDELMSRGEKVYNTNCVACHQAGKFKPRNVALGTRGSDIMTMGQRIRPRFFQRWMKNPIQVIAGIEMPALKRGVSGIADGDLTRQTADGFPLSLGELLARDPPVGRALGRRVERARRRRGGRRPRRLHQGAASPAAAGPWRASTAS